MARISIPMLGFLFLVLCCCASKMAEANGYVTYKDPNRPLGARLRDLLKRMTVEEKIGQMVQIERANATADIMKNYFIGMHIYVLTMIFGVFEVLIN
jgi:beta-glucosidase